MGRRPLMPEWQLGEANCYWSKTMQDYDVNCHSKIISIVKWQASPKFQAPRIAEAEIRLLCFCLCNLNDISQARLYSYLCISRHGSRKRGSFTDASRVDHRSANYTASSRGNCCNFVAKMVSQTAEEVLHLCGSLRSRLLHVDRDLCST